jgi:hypothetical protein
MSLNSSLITVMHNIGYLCASVDVPKPNTTIIWTPIVDGMWLGVDLKTTTES